MRSPNREYSKIADFFTDNLILFHRLLTLDSHTRSCTGSLLAARRTADDEAEVKQYGIHLTAQILGTIANELPRF